MKLEVGKEYIDGNGAKITIVSAEQRHPGRETYLGSNGKHYFSNGWVDVDDKDDLVEEYHEA